MHACLRLAPVFLLVCAPSVSAQVPAPQLPVVDAAPPPSAADAFGSAEQVLALDEAVSTSLGGPSSGHLLGGVALPDRGSGFLHNEERPSQARYGTVELVQTIVRAAAVVDRELPGSVLVVNDLGLPEGGRIAQHGSHQAGRDADILFYSLDAQGGPIPSVGVPIDPQGKGWDFKDLTTPKDDQRVKLDAQRTWRFVQALLETASASVQRIFLVEHVRTMLLAQAEKVHAPRAIRQRFEDITCQPASPHDDHMHVRLFCSPQDLQRGCEDSPPIYPWRNELLKVLGLRSVIASGYHTKEERADVQKRTTSPAQARKRAGAMDARVIRFLDERAHWIVRPHPGRPYCR